MRRVLAAVLGLAAVFAVPSVPSLARTGAAPPAKRVCHAVTKKVHGKKKRVKVCKTVRAKKVIVGATTFYSATDVPPSGSCTAPSQQAGTSFLSTVPVIMAVTSVKKWKGTHKWTWNWINPSGSVAVTTTGSYHDIPSGNVLCEELYVGGRASTAVSGTWRLQLVLGRKVVRTVRYTMTRTSDSLVQLGDPLIMYRIPAGLAMAASTPCQTTGVTASASALVTDQYVLVYVPINVWQGTHTIRFQWNGPDGYSASSPYNSYTDLGFQRYWCAPLQVAGAAEAGHPGDWSVGVYIDNSPVATQNFSLS